jgi:hypothetical protein
MENRHGLLVDAYLTEASGYAERAAALQMIGPFANRSQAITPGADKTYGTKDFVKDLRSMKVTPCGGQLAHPQAHRGGVRLD